MTPTPVTPGAHRPRRDDDVAAWLKFSRDGYRESASQSRSPAVSYNFQQIAEVLDGLLDDYRAHADYGVPLDHELEGSA